MKDEADNASRIIRVLNQGLELPQAVAARLHEARQRALGRQRSAEGVPALPGGLRLPGTGWLPRFAFPALLVLALMFSGHQWTQWNDAQQAEQHAARQAEIAAATVSSEAAQQAEIDAAMVSEELPLQAYLDRDFYVWLYTPHEQSSSF